MFTKTLALGLGGALLAAGLISGSTQVAAEDVVKIGSHTPPKAQTLVKGTLPILRQMEKDSGGALRFQEFWGGQLVRSPRKQYEAMLNGLQDMSPLLPSYTQKLFPDFELFSLPFMFQSATEASIASWKMYEKGLLGGLDKLYIVAVYTNDNSGMHFRDKITKLEDIKGKKIRAAGPGEADAIKAMGAVPVSMSITQVAESLNRGVIQGTLNGWSALRSFKITPLIKTHVDMPFGVRSFFLAMTRKKFDSLSPKSKAAVRKNSGLEASKHNGEVNDGMGNAMRNGAAKAGRNVIKPTSAQRKKYAAIMKKSHEEWIAKTPNGRKKYDALQAILADLRKGS